MLKQLNFRVSSGAHRSLIWFKHNAMKTPRGLGLGVGPYAVWSYWGKFHACMITAFFYFYVVKGFKFGRPMPNTRRTWTLEPTAFGKHSHLRLELQYPTRMGTAWALSNSYQCRKLPVYYVPGRVYHWHCRFYLRLYAFFYWNWSSRLPVKAPCVQFSAVIWTSRDTVDTEKGILNSLVFVLKLGLRFRLDFAGLQESRRTYLWAIRSN